MSTDFTHKDKKRARRRADKERRHRQELKKIDHRFSSPEKRGPNFEQWREKQAQRNTDTRKGCSCWMCGNPRRIFKDNLTMQEKRFCQREKFCDSVD